MSFLEDDFFDTFSKRGWKGVLDEIFGKGKILEMCRRSIVKNSEIFN